jgi:hypothetical protein
VQCAKKVYKTRFKKDPMKDPNLIVYLGDNFAARKTWSAISGRLPTMRMSGGKLWSISRRRWLTGREKMASLGFPVSEATANAAWLHE